MVEMVETAAILHQATPQSLVILDEIGRGTSTYDGLSIAWAVLEHLHHTNKCRGLFATHYHELTALAASLPALSCHTMRVKEWNGDVVFLYEVTEGNADRSYGVHVAKLAGLPKPVITRAAEVLSLLETDQNHQKLNQLSDNLPLFTAAPKPDGLREKLNAIQPDSLSPREALELLYQLKGLANA
jgi:DNA mismatch repair protein MutS